MLTRGVTLGIMQTPKPTKAGGSDFCLARGFTKKGGLAKLRRKFRWSHGYHLGVVATCLKP